MALDQWNRDVQRQPAFVRFQNKTPFDVEIIWMNTDNIEEIYTFLAPDKFLDVNTYSTHPWIFRECISKSRMLVDGKEMYLPKPWIEEFKRLNFEHPISVPLRTFILIQMPVLDLRQLCLLKIVKKLKTKDDVMSLEIPAILQKELKEMISNKDIVAANINKSSHAFVIFH